MARRTSMRMGSLNLLVLVIALCLAVMGVLSVVTAQASGNLSARQAETSQDLYAEESAAQYMLSEVDSILANVRQGHVRPSRIIGTISDASQRICTAAEELEASQAVGLTASLETFTPSSASPSKASGQSSITLDDNPFGSGQTASQEPTISPFLAESMEGCTGGVTFTLKTPSGLNLACMIGLYPDGTYTIFQWETFRSWNEAVRNEMLWTGN